MDGWMDGGWMGGWMGGGWVDGCESNPLLKLIMKLLPSRGVWMLITHTHLHICTHTYTCAQPHIHTHV